MNAAPARAGAAFFVIAQWFRRKKDIEALGANVAT